MGRLRPGFNFTAGRAIAVVPESFTEINDVELQCAYGIAVQDRMHPPRRAHSAASMILSWPPCRGSDDVTGRSEERGPKTARCRWWRPGGGGCPEASCRWHTG